MGQCVLMCLSISYYRGFIWPWKTICWHSLKARVNIHFSRGWLFFPLKVAWRWYWSGTNINWACRTVVPWVSQAASLGCRFSAESPCVSNVAGMGLFSLHPWRALLGVRSGMAGLFWFIFSLRMEPFRIPALQGGSSVRLALALVYSSVHIF